MVKDKQVLQLWTRTGRKVSGHYQFPIPFKKNFPAFPNNKALVEHRLIGLQKRLMKDPHLKQRYSQEI